MSISYDKPNKRWRYQFDRRIAGERVRASQLLPKGWTRAQADTFDQKETARLYGIATGVIKPEPLIDQAVLLYLQHHGPKLKSFENIKRELNECADIYTGRPFSALPDIAREYRPVRVSVVDGREVETPLAPATVKNRLSYIRAACRYAWKQHQLGDHDPAERMEMPKVRNERHVYLNRRQFLEVCKHIPAGAARAGVRIAFYSGMRAGEVGKCTLYDAGGAQVFMLPPDMTKNGNPRAVPIHPKLAHIVRNPQLWPLPRARWTVSKDFKKAARAAGYGHARLHDMRHSTASEMLNGGAHLTTVGGVLGHLSPVSTRRYAHLVVDTLTAAVHLVGKKSPTTPKKKAA